MFKIFTRGGQTTLHQIRMFRQAAIAVIWITLFVSVTWFSFNITKTISSNEVSLMSGYYSEKLKQLMPNYDCKKMVKITHRTRAFRESKLQMAA